MGVVKLEKLVKIYGKDIKAVKGIDLEIKDGEFFVLLGPSGCGKTTTMRMIAGLEEVTQGSIFIDGKEITHLEPRYRDIGMVFQNYATWPHMTVFDNIAFSLKLKKYPAQDIEKIVRQVCQMTDIIDYLDRYPTQLSGGQRQRVAVARALAVNPKVFLMDEPLSALDAKLRESMRTELKQIQRKTGATTVYVTHDQAEAMSLADRIMVMKEGAIMQIGTPQEVYSNCENMFIADFIGTPPTNFWDIEVQETKDRACLLSNKQFKLNYAGAAIDSIKKYCGKTIAMGIRPENILLAGSREDTLFQAECLLVEPQGAYKVVIFNVNNKKRKMIVAKDVKVKIGERLKLQFDLSKVMFFDQQTEKRIK